MGMQKSYTKNYLKIYFWQILSILLNLFSIFIVIPRLSSQPLIYGIYSICASAVIFLSYADLGFMNAGYKYASECYARGEKKEEIKVIGFVSFVLAFFVLLFALTMFFFSLHPEWLIKGATDVVSRKIASNLLLTLAVFSFSVVLQRGAQIVFGIRLEDYVFQRILIVVSLLKIASVFFFFRTGNYDIVGYFFFCQLIALLGLLYAFYVAGKKYGISLITFLRAVRFSQETYNRIKALAFSSLFVTISWILYYELDVYAVARFSGAKAVAFYAIGLTCLSFFRSIFGTLFNPFTARFNYFIAHEDEQGLRQFYKTVLCVMLPAVVFPVLSVALLSKPFVYAWVGDKFTDSVLIVRLLVLSNILGFIAYPCGILTVARQQIRALYWIAAIQPVLFWLGVLVMYTSLDYLSFSYAKLAVFLINGALYAWLSVQFLKLTWWQFLKQIILPAVIPVTLFILIIYNVRDYLPLGKNKLNLLFVISCGAGATAVGVVTYYLTSPVFKTYVNNIVFKKIFKKVSTS